MADPKKPAEATAPAAKPAEATQPRRQIDPELKAMGAIGEILAGLTPDGCERVMVYVNNRVAAKLKKPLTVSEATDGNRP